MTGLKHFVTFHGCEQLLGWGTAQCEMLLFCVKTIMKESHYFELAHLQKKMIWSSDYFLVGTLVTLFHATGCVAHLEDEQYFALKVYCF